MRIIYDSQIFAAQVYGGVSRYFVELAAQIQELQQGGVEIFSPVYVNAYLAQRPILCPTGRRVRNVRFGNIPMRAINYLATRALVSGRDSVDIFHPTYYSAFDCAPASARTVLTVHDMTHEIFPASFSRRDRTPRAKQIAVRRADHVICVSDSTRRDLLSFLDVDPAKVSVVHHGNSLVQDPRIGRKHDSRKPFVLYVGAREGYKNFGLFLRAFADSRLPAEGYALVCFGGGGFLESERILMQTLRVAERVRHVSGTDSELAALYSEAQLLAYPSLYEGFGFPVLEAMSLGCPVACSNTSSLPEITGHAALMFDPSSVEEMRMSLEKIASDGGLADELASRGTQRAKEFSWRTCAQSTLDVYRHVARR